MPGTSRTLRQSVNMYALAVLVLLFARTESGLPLNAMRAAKCIIPNGLEHITRAAFLQQCISKNYAQGNETQCYPELGCFPMDSPWTSTLRPLPSPLHPAEINVQLYCYTRVSSERYNITLWPEVSLNGCPFQAGRNTVFVTHGFASSGNSSWLSDLKDRYLRAEDVNVFLVDWGKGAQLFNYLQVASNTRIAGAELARFIKYLIAQYGLESSRIHLLGHSLGAHISAYAAKANPGVRRLTAMDPAQPGFEGTDHTVRLNMDDAQLVEVIHTNSLPFIPSLGFGLIRPHGHVDFYMNGGLRQPGCQVPDVTEIKSLTDLAKFPVEVVNMWVSCSHGRAYEFFMSVLDSNCIIWGRQATLPRHIINAATLGYIEPLFSSITHCNADSCLPLGLQTPRFKARGTFAASTRNSPPYCEADPEVNKRIFSEIKDEGATESTTKLFGIVKEAKDKSIDMASGLRRTIGGVIGLKSNTSDKVLFF